MRRSGSARTRGAGVCGAVLALVIAGLAGCASSTVLSIGSPFDRYDHNRTRLVQGVRLTDEMLSPPGSPTFTRLPTDRASAVDSMPAANLTPVFTGVPLPLAADAVAGGRSDRDDLVDFLAAGPNAQVGVEPPDTAGEVAMTARCYADVLALLSSPAGLGGGAQGLRDWARCCDVKFATDVVDPRYRIRAFDEVVAFRYREFWFVLYRLPRAAAFSRLVVAPVRIKGQQFIEKTVSPGC